MSRKDLRQKDPNEVVINYKNINYSDNIPSKDSIHTPLSLQCSKLISHSREQSRPISCPLCAKMIAMSSILVHFYFDHAKVLKLRINTSKRQHILVKAADISFETKCIAVLLLEGESLTGNLKSNSTKTNNVCPLLVLSAKMNVGSLSKDLCLKNYIEETRKQSPLRGHTFGKNEVILIWTCKTNDDELISKVKISRKDKKLSFGYTGESIHIRENIIDKTPRMCIYKPNVL